MNNFDIHALANALNGHVRVLMQTYVSLAPSAPLCRSSEQAAAILRIEASPEAIWSMRRADTDGSALNLQGGRSGEPMRFMGVSLYEVHHQMPPEGWQIINPFRK